MPMQYYEIACLGEVYLEDSFVLAIRESADAIELEMEVVLREGHPRYSPPKPNEQYCYCRGRLVFKGLQSVRWQERGGSPSIDKEGEVDFGGIDAFYRENGEYRLCGEWGNVSIRSRELLLDLDGE